MKISRHCLLSSTIIILAFSFTSCKIEVDTTIIRVHNASQYDFKDVEINPYNESVNYGDIRSGEKTEYRPFEIAYRYAYVRLLIDDKEFIIQPIDYFGETPLGPGRFTYILTVADVENRMLNIAAVKDD